MDPDRGVKYKGFYFPPFRLRTKNIVGVLTFLYSSMMKPASLLGCGAAIHTETVVKEEDSLLLYISVFTSVNMDAYADDRFKLLCFW